MGDFENLLKPIMIGNLEIKNRMVMPSMDTRLPNEDCTVSQQQIDYYEARAKGGFGLILTEYCFVSPKGRPHTYSTGICDDKYLPGLTKLAAAVHKHEGAKIFAQIFHCGSQGTPERTGFDHVYGPSTVSNLVTGAVPAELTREHIYEIIEDFGDAAVRAKKAGFDGVELHGGHGYLISEFITLTDNKRTDEFGGNFLGRMRFPKLIIENIRKKVGPDFPITMRISAEPMTPNGKGREELVAMAMYLEKCGIQAFNVSTMGWKYIIAPNQQPVGYNIPYVEPVTKAVSVPVIGGGRMNDPYIIDQSIQNGKIDMVYLGRESLADPAFPNKVAEGLYEEICPCIGCIQRCQLHLFDHSQHISCMLNPFTGREGTWKIVPAETKKKIAVVGAGPAGLNFAYIAAQRGHEVTVFEKGPNPGGQLRTGSIAPFKNEIARAIKYAVTMCDKYGVEIRYNTEATEEVLLNSGFNSVVLCTGGVPVVPNIPGIDGERVLLAEDVLNGNTVGPKGKILIVGAGQVGVETADYLTERNMGFNQISVVEMTSNIMPQEHFTAKAYIMDRMKEHNVQFVLNTKITEFTETGIVAERAGETVTMDGFDFIILAMGTKAYNPLEEKLEGKIDYYKAGDVIKARNAVSAIEEAVKLGLEI